MLVLLKDESMDNQAIEHEVELINEMLFHVESPETFCRANEIIDMNKYKVLHDQKYLVQLMYQSELKPFIFLCNKN